MAPERGVGTAVAHRRPLRARMKTRGKASTRAATPSRPGWLERPLDHFWQLLTSVRLALVLILLLAAGTLAGTTLIQAPGGIAPGSADYASWLQRVRPRFGDWTDVLSSLQLLSVFSSVWYRGLLAALSISILLCTAKRWPASARASFSPRIRRVDRFFEHAPLAASIESPAEPDHVAQVLRSTLGKHRYRVLMEQATETCYQYADRNRFAPLGTYLSHLSLILILAGALLGGWLGFNEKGFAIPEGATREVGFGTGLSVKAVSFVDEYYPEGPPKDYRSDLVVYQNGIEVKRQTIRVNEPLDYQGVRFFQSFFGPAVDLEVKVASGDVIFSDGVALVWQTQGDRPAGSFVLPQRNLTAYVIGPASAKRDLSIKSGEMRVELYQGRSSSPVAMANLQPGQTTEMAGLQFTFLRERQFTGLQVAKDPASPLIWLGCILLVLGQMAVWYFPHRRLWAMVRGRPEGGTEVALGAVVRRDTGFNREFHALVAELRSRVGGTQDAKETVHG